MNVPYKVEGIDGLVDVYLDSTRFIKQVLLEKEYQDCLRFDTVIDLGANIGDFSLAIYDWANKIYAIEPLDRNFENLNKTVEENHLDKIKTFHLAITDGTGKGVISASGEELDWGSWQLKEGGERKQEVDITTLAKFINDNGIEYVDLLKVDVEGSEEKIFRCPDFKTVASKIGIIIGEVHANTFIQSVLEENGFRYTVFPQNHFRAVRI